MCSHLLIKTPSGLNIGSNSVEKHLMCHRYITYSAFNVIGEKAASESSLVSHLTERKMFVIVCSTDILLLPEHFLK